MVMKQIYLLWRIYNKKTVHLCYYTHLCTNPDIMGIVQVLEVCFILPIAFHVQYTKLWAKPEANHWGIESVIS